MRSRLRGRACMHVRRRIDLAMDRTVVGPHRSVMATTLIVMCSSKDQQGNIIGIGGANWQHTAATAIQNLRNGIHEYRLLRANGPLVRPYGTNHLTSDRDGVTGNNLDSIPNC